MITSITQIERASSVALRARMAEERAITTASKDVVVIISNFAEKYWVYSLIYFLQSFSVRQ